MWSADQSLGWNCRSARPDLPKGDSSISPPTLKHRRLTQMPMQYQLLMHRVRRLIEWEHLHGFLFSVRDQTLVALQARSPDQAAPGVLERFTAITSRIAPIVDYHTLSDQKPSCVIHRKVPNKTVFFYNQSSEPKVPLKRLQIGISSAQPVKISVASVLDRTVHFFKATYTTRRLGFVGAIFILQKS